MTTSKIKVMGQTLTIAQLENFEPYVDGKAYLANVSEVFLILVRECHRKKFLENFQKFIS